MLPKKNPSSVGSWVLQHDSILHIRLGSVCLKTKLFDCQTPPIMAAGHLIGSLLQLKILVMLHTHTENWKVPGEHPATGPVIEHAPDPSKNGI